MKRIKLLTAIIVFSSLSMFGQGAKNIKINEVMTNNTASIVDEYDHHLPWVELANTSFTTFSIRGMYIATDKAVLNPNLSVPERVAMMSIIPGGNSSNMGGRQHLLFFLNSSPVKGLSHLTSTIDPSGPVWIGLYEGNGVDLVDSVTIPVVLNANTTYARVKDGSQDWEVKAADAVTPGIENFISVTETKVAQIKRDDPHGFGITLLSMVIVFSCLALLCIFFTIFGKIMSRKQQMKQNSAKQARKNRLEAVHDEDEDERAFPGIVVKKNKMSGAEADDDVYVAVISMALRQYLEHVHDEESGIITLIPKTTKWTRI